MRLPGLRQMRLPGLTRQLAQRPHQSMRTMAPVPRWAACAAARRFSAEASPATAEPELKDVTPPTGKQLRQLFVNSMVPFIAFGFVDNTVLIYSGDYIDNTMGVLFGLPTLAAAASGQVFSDTCGVMCGGTIEAICLKLGLPLPGLTDEQCRLGITKRITIAGSVVGVVMGCSLGMCNLFLIDLKASERAKKAKELETIMKTVMAHGVNSMTCERATLWVVDDESDELWSSVAHGVEGILRIPKDEKASVAAWVASHKEVANISDVTKDSRWTGDKVGGFATRNMLVAPVLNSDGEVVAVIQLMNKKEGTGGFDSSDEKALDMLCTHVAIFLDQLGD